MLLGNMAARKQGSYLLGLIAILIGLLNATATTTTTEQIEPRPHSTADDFEEDMINITEAQSALFDRIRASKYLVNVYNLKPSEICPGTNSGFSSGRNVYQKLRAVYTHCVYVDGNVEINNFDPFNEDDADIDYGRISEGGEEEDQILVPDSEYDRLDAEYDFSFLDNIREITGYLLIHNTKARTLRFKSLEIVRGKNLIKDKYSVFIDSNIRLETLDLTNLKAIQSGMVYIHNNPDLCHMDEVNWLDILSKENRTVIFNNGEPEYCTERCQPTCCNNNNSKQTSLLNSTLSKPSSQCGCWFPNGCQKLSKVVCDERCEDRCYGSAGNYGCCNAQCLGGCTGPKKSDCIACKKLRINDTGECVESCPRIHVTDTLSGDLVLNPNGTYQYGTTCVRQCPANFFIYQDFCLPRCPNYTFEDEELINNPETGEKGFRRICKPCTKDKCPKTCTISKIDNKNKEMSVKDLKNLEDCEVLNSDLIILQPDIESNITNPSILRELAETDLEVMSSIRIINGFVRIQSNRLKNLSFLRNLEVIRANNLVGNKFSVIIHADSLKTLGLLKLRKIENGDVHLQTSQICLEDTIDWGAIMNRNNSIRVIKQSTRENCTAQGLVCDQTCNGCWSTGPTACQFCKQYKLDQSCVHSCGDGQLTNGRYTYVANNATRECRYCHPECKSACTGPTEYDCLGCLHYELKQNVTNMIRRMCVNKCLSSHYPDNTAKVCRECDSSCYGCTGPRNTISPGGCTNCNSALVDNDAAYSIIKCIKRDEFVCSKEAKSIPVRHRSSNSGGKNNGAPIIKDDDYSNSMEDLSSYYDDDDNYENGDEYYFWMLVPENLPTHPLKDKKVCRKCNRECAGGCFSNGALLGENCRRCRNFYSNSTNECVSNCSKHNEYPEKGTKNCLPCNKECKSGCNGTAIYECNQCRSNKLRLVDMKWLVDKLAADRKYYEAKSEGKSYEERQIDLSSRLLIDMREEARRRREDASYFLNGGDRSGKEAAQNDLVYSLVQSYQDYYVKKAFLSGSETPGENTVVFCASECPPQMPYQNSEFFCTKEKSIKDSTDFVRIIIAFSILAVIILGGSLILSGVCVKYFDNKNRKKILFEDGIFDPSLRKDAEAKFDQDNMASLLIVQDDKLTLIRELGAGAFGRVFEGYWRTTNFKSDRNEEVKLKVAIKQLTPMVNDRDKLKDFHEDIINEATLMASVNHKHCLQLSALCLVEPVRLVFRLMRYGSVVQFFANPKQRARVSEAMLLKWAEQIADGMCYLEQRGIVHRDLAARNILIKKLDHIVITDFGLAKMLDSTNEKGYLAKKNSLLPIKWMAIESIQQRIFTHKSDVWSYGVCLWEIFTFCAKPYAEIETSELVKKILSGIRLSKPPMATLPVYNVLIRCWLVDPDARPTFKDLNLDFAKFAMEPIKYLAIKKVDPNAEFVTINNEKSRELMVDEKNYNEYELDEEDMDVYADGTLMSSSSSGSGSGSGSGSNSSSRSEKSKPSQGDEEDEEDEYDSKKKAALLEQNNLSPDEGVDLNSAEMYRPINNNKRLHHKRQPQTAAITEPDAYNDVVTFKRPAVPNQPAPLPTTRQMSSGDDYTSINEIVSPLPSSSRPIRFFRRLFFPGRNGAPTPKRQQSQTSTGTTSSYLTTSSAYSADVGEVEDLLTGGDSSPTVRQLSNDRAMNNNYERQLLVSAPVDGYNTSMGDSSTPRLLSSTYATPASNGAKFVRTSSSIRNRDSNKTNSDYLEPISHNNVRQNFEYFNSQSRPSQQAPTSVIVMPPSTTGDNNNNSKRKSTASSNLRPNYYNDTNVTTYIEDQNPIL